ncbi:MAG: MASE1 domain-containing protein [Bacteroidota bacterium]
MERNSWNQAGELQTNDYPMKNKLIYFVKILLLAIIYFGAAKLGLSLAFLQAQVSPIWPPTGIALAVMLVFGYKMWPGIFIGALLTNIATAETLPVALTISLGNTLEVLVGAYLLQRFVSFQNSMDRLRDVLGLLLFGCTVSPAISATIGVSTLGISGLMPWSEYIPVWLTWRRLGMLWV